MPPLTHPLMRWLRLGLAALLALAALGLALGLSRTADADPVTGLAFTAEYDRPLLLTQTGGLLLPAADADGWRTAVLTAPTRALYAEADGTWWAAGDGGLWRRDRAGAWTAVEGVPAVREVTAMHGYTFALGEAGLFRGPGDWRRLALPVADAAPTGFVMLADHSHATLAAGTIYLTHDMGLGWETLDTPADTRLIWSDTAGALLAVTDRTVQRWTTRERRWTQAAPLPAAAPITLLRNYQDTVYALAGGQLYRQAGAGWQAIVIPAAPLIALERRRLSELWALEAGGQRLWVTRDGATWESLPIRRVAG